MFGPHWYVSSIMRHAGPGTGQVFLFYNGLEAREASSCPGPAPLGATCSTGTNCLSGHCVATHCCQSACAGSCELCGSGYCSNATSADTTAGTRCEADNGVCGSGGVCTTAGAGNSESSDSAGSLWWIVFPIIAALLLVLLAVLLIRRRNKRKSPDETAVFMDDLEASEGSPVVSDIDETPSEAEQLNSEVSARSPLSTEHEDHTSDEYSALNTN